ncbi:MAG: ankyrin repeat domain-containing protein, partial [Betaproteobacteria bacterium]|nr:ankyrin repeat domain-containing protein [Betaproteobacteria bacterium]
IAAGAGVNLSLGERGFTPLHIAGMAASNPQVIDVLIAAGANISSKTAGGSTPLDAAAAQNSEARVIDALIAAGADLESRDNEGNTPLHWAVHRNPNPQIARALIAAGADFESRNNEGEAPLHWAVTGSKPDAVRVLINAGADPNGCFRLDEHNQCAPVMFIAFVRGDPEVIEQLKAAGAKDLSLWSLPYAHLVRFFYLLNKSGWGWTDVDN